MYNVETKSFLLSEFGGSSKLSQEANEKSLQLIEHLHPCNTFLKRALCSTFSSSQEAGANVPRVLAIPSSKEFTEDHDTII